jgi:shikimate dehydrogenase
MTNTIKNTITGYTKITGVIGDNIQYTKSPLIHNYWYTHYNIDGVYLCFNTTLDSFETAVKGLFASGVIGLNVTVPFKERAFLLCDITSDAAQKAQAVNCLTYKDNKIIGHNTDGIGFYNALRHLDNNLDLNNKTILMIGAGGASASIISYLSQFSVKIKILNRTFDKAKLLVDKFVDIVDIQAVQIPCVCDILIQTTNVKKIETGNILDIPVSIIAQAHYVIDINYGDNAGDFLLKPQSMGIKNCDGSEMLLEQAKPAFELFNNISIEISETIRKKLTSNDV